nr:hypothetical protein [Tanacetum cinerariifolium]
MVGSMGSVSEMEVIGYGRVQDFQSCVRYVGNKMHKAFPLLEESSHWQYKFPLPVEGVPTARRIEIPLPRVCTAMMKKLPAFPLPGESSHWQYKFPLPVKVVPTARRLEMPLPGVCTAIEKMMKKLSVKDRWQLH